jgi:hypothetical protein
MSRGLTACGWNFDINVQRVMLGQSFDVNIGR